MVSLRYMDSWFKEYCKVSDSYIDTLHDIFENLKIAESNCKTYAYAKMYDEYFAEDKKFRYLADLLDDLLTI